MHTVADNPTEMHRLKTRIAEVYAQRECLKRALETGALAPRAGFDQLNEADRLLSDLDTRFKSLWDAARAATQWAHDTAFETIQLDCIATIMLKILDGKCKMDETAKTALAAVYDAVRTQPGHLLGDEVHALIAQARRGADPALAEAVHAWRVRAESLIPKPAMKAFKQELRSALFPAGDAPEDDDE
jgi:hypothetical protein